MNNKLTKTEKIWIYLFCLFLFSIFYYLYYKYIQLPRNEIKQSLQNTVDLIETLSIKNNMLLNELFHSKSNEYICISLPYEKIISNETIINNCPQFKNITNLESIFSMTFIDTTSCSMNRNIYAKYYKNDVVNFKFNEKNIFFEFIPDNEKCKKIKETSTIQLEVDKNFVKTVKIGA